MARLSAKQKAEYLGAAPKKLDRELRAFSRAARLLSSSHSRLIDKHPKQWVAIYGGKVRASAKSLDAIISKLERQGLPPNEAIIRYIDSGGRKLIL
jgi:CII-binding regulator of phage lambda lysogenization HflD